MNMRDALLALSIVILWALHNVLIRVGVLEIPPFMLLTFRMAGTALLFAPFARKLKWSELRDVSIYSATYIFLHIGLLAVGLHYLEASPAALILQTTMPFAVLFGWLMHKETFGLKTLGGLALAFIGVLLVLYKPAQDFSYLGAGLILFSSMCWGFGSVFARRTTSVDVATLVAYAHAIPLPFFLILSLVFESGDYAEIQHSANWWIVLGVWAYQVFIVSFCHGLWRGVIARNPVYLVTSFTMIQPVVSVVFAHFVLGEVLSPLAIIGGAISLAGVGIVTIRKIQTAKKAPVLGPPG